MDNVTTVWIDLAKNVFSVHGVDAGGVGRVRKTVSSRKLMELVAQLSPCVIGLEACSGAHEWARRIGVFGHNAKLMAPKLVAPYRPGGKNDGNDVEAIRASDRESAQRPSGQVGLGSGRASRVPPSLRGHRSQARSDHLGAAGERAATEAGVIQRN